MTSVFADSSYFVALMSGRDAWHKAVLRWNCESSRSLISTEFVLLEVANAFCASQRRVAFRILPEELEDEPSVRIVAASTTLFRAGLELYLRRHDKDWSLTDCISFVVMKQHGLAEALTTDHHFEQAGFKSLLK